MQNFIKTYDDTVSKDLCQNLIHDFETRIHHHEKVITKEINFTQINLLDHQEWHHYVQKLVNVFTEYINKYISDCNIGDSVFPEKYSFEAVRMKRYLPNGEEQFLPHVDVNDHMSAKRFLAFFIYLNDNDAGNTTFPNFKINVQPKQGKMLIFPPMWTHMHAGEPPVDSPKYIIGSYLHYK